MVSIKSIVIASALVVSSAMGRVGSMSAPDTVQAGQNITATLIPRGSLSNWDDFGVIWALKGKDLSAEYIGHQLSYDAIYPNNIIKNRTFEVPTVSYGTTPGEYILTAAIPYLVGASGITDFNYFTHNITITE